MKTYKYRAECEIDVKRAADALNTPMMIVGRHKICPDVVVVFDSSKDLQDIKAVLMGIVDSHVMVETVQPISEYTGMRN